MSGTELLGLVATCDNGDFAVGAGWSFDGEGVEVTGSLPGEGFLGYSHEWQVYFTRVAPGGSVPVQVWVRCLDLTP